MMTEQQSVTSILDPAHLVLFSVFDPSPAHQEPQKVMLGLHESYHDLQRTISNCAGRDEAAIVQAVSTMITRAAAVAVFFARNKQ